MADWPMIKIEVAFSRRARRRNYGTPKGWGDVRPMVACLMTVDNDMETRAAAYNRRYAKANPHPLAADGSAYHLRSLARRRRRG